MVVSGEKGGDVVFCFFVGRCDFEYCYDDVDVERNDKICYLECFCFFFLLYFW